MPIPLTKISSPQRRSFKDNPGNSASAGPSSIARLAQLEVEAADFESLEDEPLLELPLLLPLSEGDLELSDFAEESDFESDLESDFESPDPDPDPDPELAAAALSPDFLPSPPPLPDPLLEARESVL